MKSILNYVSELSGLKKGLPNKSEVEQLDEPGEMADAMDAAGADKAESDDSEGDEFEAKEGESDESEPENDESESSEDEVSDSDEPDLSEPEAGAEEMTDSGNDVYTRYQEAKAKSEEIKAKIEKVQEWLKKSKPRVAGLEKASDNDLKALRKSLKI